MFGFSTSHVDEIKSNNDSCDEDDLFLASVSQMVIQDGQWWQMLRKIILLDKWSFWASVIAIRGG